MAAQDFSKLYYRTANCLTSDIIADFAPVSRVLGVDRSAGMGTLFTAMGTRFDMEYVAEEAFMATDNYEADTRSIDDTPVTEAMRYIRGELIKDGKVPEKYKSFVDCVVKGESVYKQYKTYTDGQEDADILFLISPAADAGKEAEQFQALAKKTGRRAFCTNRYKDCGYLRIQLSQFDSLEETREELEKELEKYELIVTDDGYVLDALLIVFPQLAGKIQFIDEFVYANKEVLQTAKEGRIAVHESGVIERLYPHRKVNYADIFSKSEIVFPERSGYDVTDSGLAGGLGLVEPENMMAIAARRMKDLSGLSHSVIVTPCACEALGLNCAEKENVVTLLDFVSSEI